MKRIILIGCFLLCCHVSLFAQTDSRSLVIPDAQMEQFVKQIVTRYFPASSKPKTIYIAAHHIKKEWLPRINNIKFVFVEDPSGASNCYFFSYGKWQGSRRLTVNFGYGNPFCSAKGDTWSVDIRSSRIKLRLVSTKFFLACNLECMINDPM